MRIQFVFPNLACGGAVGTEDALVQVLNRGITHILDLDHRCEAEKIEALMIEALMEAQDFPGAEVLHYHIPDDGTPRPKRFWSVCIPWALDVLAEPDSKLFIHCAAGRSRSVSLLYGVIRACGHSVDDTLTIIGADDHRKRILKASLRAGCGLFPH